MLPLTRAPLKTSEKSTSFQASEDGKTFTALILMGELTQQKQLHTFAPPTKASLVGGRVGEGVEEATNNS